MNSAPSTVMSQTHSSGKICRMTWSIIRTKISPCTDCRISVVLFVTFDLKDKNPVKWFFEFRVKKLVCFKFVQILIKLRSWSSRAVHCCSRAESLKSRDDELNCSHNVRSNKKVINKSIIFNCKNINCVNVDLCVLVQLLFMLITRSRQNNIWFSESFSHVPSGVFFLKSQLWMLSFFSSVCGHQSNKYDTWNTAE